ncbi:MAG: PCMD domain-containing protein [Muribaculaceae bacterium]|nr:PCMD domain-containing protein [Muribaculaceae bacterium]
MKLRHTLLAALAIAISATAQTIEKLPYGDMNSWVTRDIKESGLLGGKWQKCYAVGPTMTVRSDKPYVNAGGSPWASSNVMAKVMGVTKVSTSVYPADREGQGKCARLTTDMQHCKAIGVVNVDVVVAGTLFLGQMLEPISSTKDPYSKMEMGIEYTKRPAALVYDFKLVIPAGAGRTYSSGFGKKRNISGEDKAEVFIYLQRRWEDADGNIHAKRVGTGRELLGDTSGKWLNGHRLKVHYGDITSQSYYRKSMGLIPAEKSYYARNSKGKMVPVVEEGWDSADATPTHMMVMFSAGSGEPYMGTIGTEFLVDNVQLMF